MVAEARDRMEAQRIAKLTWALTKEKEEALRKQWEECERIKEKAVADAIAETTRRLRNEFTLQKELAVAKALQIARVGLFGLFRFEYICQGFSIGGPRAISVPPTSEVWLFDPLWHTHFYLALEHILLNFLWPSMK